MRSLLLALVLLAFLAVASPASAAILDIKEVTSRSGIKAWLVEDHSVAVISLRFLFKGAGSAQDSLEKQGLARMLSNTMDEGAGDLDGEAFQRALSDHSISLSFSATRDDFSGELKTLTRHREQAFRLLGLALNHPRFDQEAVDRMRNANLARIRNDMTDPDWIAARLMNDTLYQGHPYAMNSGGTLSSLVSITPEDLKLKAATALSRDHLIVSAAGDINAAELARILDDIFGSLPQTSTNQSVVGGVSLPGKTATVLFPREIPQTIIQMALPGIGWADPDYCAAEVMNFILGGAGFGSRLTEVIREKRGLTYGIYSGMSHSDHANLLTIGSSTKNASAKELIDLVRGEMDKMKQSPILEKELEDAVTYLTGSVPLDLTSTDRITGYMLAFQREGLPKDYLDMRERDLKALTIADIMRVSAQLLKPDKMAIILVGKPDKLNPDRIVTQLPNVE